MFHVTMRKSSLFCFTVEVCFSELQDIQTQLEPLILLIAKHIGSYLAQVLGGAVHRIKHHSPQLVNQSLLDLVLVTIDNLIVSLTE